MKSILIVLLLCLCCPVMAHASIWNSDMPEVLLSVQLDIDNKIVQGTASLTVQPFKQLDFLLDGIQVRHVKLGGHDITASVAGGRLRVGPLNDSKSLVIGFMKQIGADNRSLESGNFMGKDFAVLMDRWCPMVDGLARYRLEALVPSGMVAVSEADRVNAAEREGGTLYSFDFPWPRREITLTAGRFEVVTASHRGIEIAAYFFPQDQGLADSYVEKVKYYIDLYSDLLPPYPFKRFAVVENLLPTGYGMATYTLLGRQVVRLPFIVDTSLGHEFVHSWFGNSVYVDMSLGNWCEGLTTFLADALYLKLQGKGAEYRHRALTEYQAWVHGPDAISLAEFRGQRGRASRAVGYGKAAMLFHMLKMRVGEEVFTGALGRLVQDYSFRQASWRDIEEVFEKESGKSLDWFFKQWLFRNDVPILEFSDVDVRDEEGKNSITFKVVQKSDTPYRLHLPVSILTGSGVLKRDIELEDHETAVKLQVSGKVYGITADPDFDLMRRLTPAEYPPVLARVFGAEQKFYMVSDEEREKYAGLVSFLVSKGFREKKTGGGHGHGEYKRGSFVMVGKVTGGLKMLAGDVTEPESGVEIRVKQGPFGSDSVVCTIMASSSQELQGIPSKLPHYGKYSELLFQNGRIKSKKTAQYQRGIRLKMRKKTMAVAAKDLFPIDKIVRYISGDRIVYVSEKHDEAGHHMAQKRIVELLHGRGVKVAVGMEMFQRPYQQALDRYIRGETDEKTFLKETQYFKRWGFDYHLYRPIIEYCRENGIPVIALNLPREISAKIAREGLDGLSSQERDALPAELDLGDQRYRQHLQDIFSQHNQPGMENFDFFFQAQVGWDETMADTAASYLREYPDTTMVVIAGVGHIAYGYGIPSRVARRIPGIEYSIIINDPGDDMVPEAGDFFLFPPEAQVEKAPKLGIMLNDDNGTIEIKKVMPGSPAEKGGVKAGDILTAFDGNAVKDINDLRLELFFKKKGDTARLTLKRDGKVVDVETGPLNSTSFKFGGAHGSPHGKGMPGSAMKHGSMKGMDKKP